MKTNFIYWRPTVRSTPSPKRRLETGWKLRDLLSTDLSGIVLDYESVYRLGDAVALPAVL